MATAIDFSMLGDSLKWTQLLGESWLIGIILTFIICLLLSRKPGNWGILFLPVLVGLKTSGLNFGGAIYALFLSLAILTFAVTTLSLPTISSAIKSIGPPIRFPSDASNNSLATATESAPSNPFTNPLGEDKSLKDLRNLERGLPVSPNLLKFTPKGKHPFRSTKSSPLYAEDIIARLYPKQDSAYFNYISGELSDHPKSDLLPFIKRAKKEREIRAKYPSRFQ